MSMLTFFASIVLMSAESRSSNISANSTAISRPVMCSPLGLVDGDGAAGRLGAADDSARTRTSTHDARFARDFCASSSLEPWRLSVNARHLPQLDFQRVLVAGNVERQREQRLGDQHRDAR